jgi:hypothetical protein
MIDDQDYQEGFRQGYRAVRGMATAVPAIPAPSPEAGKTLFQVGIKKGVEVALGKPLNSLRN